jgi:hypothetical protein
MFFYSRGAAANSAMAQVPVEACSVNALISRCSGPCRVRAATVHKRYGPRVARRARRALYGRRSAATLSWRRTDSRIFGGIE